MRTILAALALTTLACGGSAPTPTTITVTPVLEIEAQTHNVAPVVEDVSDDVTDDADDADVTDVALAMMPGLYADDVRSVEMVSAAVAFATPDLEAEKVGVIGKGARSLVRDVAPAGDGCATRWLLVEPRGWICEDDTTPSTQPPSTAKTVALDAPLDDSRPLVPGVYGTVRKNKGAQAYDSVEDARAGTGGRALVGSNSVRLKGTVMIDGRRFWRTRQGLIEKAKISTFSPSAFHGVVLAEGDALPAWARSHDDHKEDVKVRAKPSARGRVVDVLAPRTVVTIREESDDGRFARIDDDQWIAREDLRVASLAAPPDGTGPAERWFDIDLDEQILVAYEGERPVYATLVSTGKREHRTPTVITRIASKLERATMNSDATAEDVYSVADVPWTMYYDRSFALHTSYWHNGFGGTRSHGCINLAPHDARVLYHWSSPDIPAGWTAVYGDETTPGSLVRVRSDRDPEPRFRGYARELRERAQLTAL
jgi:hypothetical protein